MFDFIKQCQTKARALDSSSKCLVIGNSQGHFGSIMSAISFAFYMQNRRWHNVEDPIDSYIPVVFAQREVIETKQDVLYYLEKFGLKSEDLLCLDDIYVENYDSIIQMDYINPHSYEAFDEFTIKMVFTISEEELDFIPPPDCELIYKPAASIATAVAEYILQHDPQNLTDDDKLSLKLLYDCILYEIGDGREDEDSYPEDIQMLSELEGFLGVPDESYAEEMVGGLLVAFDDHLHLNALQLLYKYSAGTITGATGEAVYIAFLPIRMREFFERPAFRTGVAMLAEWMECNVMVVIGTALDEENNLKDDMAVISFNDSNLLYEKILDKFVNDSELKLSYRGLFPGFTGGKWFRNYTPEVPVEDIKDLLTEILNPGDPSTSSDC